MVYNTIGLIWKEFTEKMGGYDTNVYYHACSI